jgi:hypothetical protein
MLRVDARTSRELRAIVLAMAQTDKVIASQIRKNTRKAILPEWKRGLAEHAETRMQHRVLVDTGAATVTNLTIKLTAGTKGKPLRGGLDPRKESRSVEFGTIDREKKREYWTNSRNGNPYKVKRRTNRQMPSYRRQGHVFYPTANQLIPRILSLYAQTTVRTLAEALEGKSNG